MSHIWLGTIPQRPLHWNVISTTMCCLYFSVCLFIHLCWIGKGSMKWGLLESNTLSTRLHAPITAQGHYCWNSSPLLLLLSRPPIPYLFQPFLREFDSRFIDGSVTAQGHYQLDVDINCVRLQHHHLFSREHVLAARLTEQYTQYMGRSRRKAADYLTEKVCW